MTDGGCDTTARFCLRPGCPAYSDGSGYCQAHAKQARAETYRAYDAGGRDPAARRIYHSAQWLRVRSVMLAKFPVCQDCETRPSVEVHHIEKAKTRRKLLAFSNLRALCKSCHSKRTARGE